MKNTQKIANAEEILAYARSRGFEDAYIGFTDTECDGEFYETVEEIAQNYGIDETVSVAIHLILDEELAFKLIEDPEDETADAKIEYLK